MRPSARQPDELRPLRFTRHFTRHAQGSVLVEMGETRVLCTVSVEAKVPSFLQGQNRGWVTAEYGMLPGSTHTRTQREAKSGRQGGRTLEIQRLIGRALRAAVDLSRLGERTLLIDCDVLQADGGTRTASICGAWVALADALGWSGPEATHPLQRGIAAISVGVYQGEPVLDLDYAEDSSAETDLNVVMDDQGGLIEIQGTAERRAFTREELDRMLDLARSGCQTIVAAQRAALESA